MKMAWKRFEEKVNERTARWWGWGWGFGWGWGVMMSPPSPMHTGISYHRCGCELCIQGLLTKAERLLRVTLFRKSSGGRFIHTGFWFARVLFLVCIAAVLLLRSLLGWQIKIQLLCSLWLIVPLVPVEKTKGRKSSLFGRKSGGIPLQRLCYRRWSVGPTCRALPAAPR